MPDQQQNNYIRVFGKIPANISDERLKIIMGYRFGYGVLTATVLAIAMIGLGTVKAETSYGLLILLNALSFLGGGFVAWAFGYKAHPDESKPGAE